MSDAAGSSAVNLIPVRMGELAVSNEARDVFSVIGLGSCVAIILIAPQLRAGALAHVVLPEASMTGGREAPAGKFADTAVPAMVKQLQALGVEPANTYAILVGGATMFGHTHSSKLAGVGDRNIEAARQELAQLGIGIASEDVGGTIGRSVHLSLANQEVLVRSGAGQPSIMPGSARPLRVKVPAVQADSDHEPFPEGVWSSDPVNPTP